MILPVWPRPRSLWLGYLVVGAAVLFIGCKEKSPEEVKASQPTTMRIRMVEQAAEARLDFQYESGHDGESFLFPEIMGGGAAILDANGDGFLDVYFVQGGSLRDTTDKHRNRLFLGDGSGGFHDATEGSGAEDPGYGMGVAVGDFDRDGDSDMYVTNVGRNTLLRNDGAGRFTDVTEDAGVGHPGWGASAAFLDYDRDGFLDLFVTNYVIWSLDRELDCFDQSGAPDYCSPVSYNRPAPDVLFRNRGEGTFEDVSGSVGMRTEFGNGLGVAVADFDDDGFMDLFVANDQTPNQLWLNQQGSTFVDAAVITGCAVSQTGQAKAGMGVDTADVDGDLDLDLLVVNLHAQTDSFFRNQGEYFTEEAALVGLGSISRAYTRFGVGLRDFDNDGWLDLYQANGRVTLPNHRDPRIADPFAEPNVLLQGVAPGRFIAIEPPDGTSEDLIHTSRAAAFGDLDSDGAVDVIVVNRDAPAYLLSNQGAGQANWIGLEILAAHGSPALGARVSIDTPTRKLRRDVRAAYSYLASHDPRILVGLGEEEEVTAVTVRWVDGTEKEYGSQPVNRYSTLRREP